MFNAVQRIAGFPAELGVQRQYLDGEPHLVDDTLAGRLHLAPQFKIFWAVVQPIAVLVVNVFVVLQRSTKMVFHDLALFENFAPAAQIYAHVARRVQIAVRVDGSPLSASIAAGFAAKALAFVIATVRASIFVAHQTALLGFAAILTLKSRWGFVVHLEQLTYPPVLVQENL